MTSIDAFPRSMKIATPCFLILLTLFASCASIVTGSTDVVRITSTPSGADYVTNTGHQGKTPAEVIVPDKVALSVTCTYPGYESTTAVLPSRMSGWFLGNIILGGVIGIIIDLISGDWRTHDDELSIQLTPVAGIN